MKQAVRLLLILFFVLYASAAYLTAGEAEDRALAERVSDALSADSTINDLFMKTDVRDGRVILDGRAVSPEDRERAEAAARRVKGSRDVQNNLIVKPLGPEDIQTLNAMKQNAGASQQFIRNPHMPPAGGMPQHIADRATYSRSLDKMSSVLDKNIYDNYSDRDIKIRVENAVRSSPTIGRNDNITVMVQSGRVTLLGTLDCYQDQQTVVDSVSRFPGVVSVDDETQLRR